MSLLISYAISLFRQMPDWKKWEFLSRKSLNLDTCLQGCGCAERGRFNCDCLQKDKSLYCEKRATVNMMSFDKIFENICLLYKIGPL